MPGASRPRGCSTTTSPGGVPTALVDALADRNQAFFAHSEVAGWRRGGGSTTGCRPAVRAAGHHRLGGPRGGPLEITDALLDEFRRLADHHERGFKAEQVMELLARADPGRFTMSGATEGS